jgi:hypothetical protein
MRFRLYKPLYDGSAVMCRVFLPDGFNRVFDLTKHNHPFIEMLVDKHGYGLEEVSDDIKRGIYEDATGRRCDEKSVEVVVKPLAPPGAEIRYLADDAPEFDPLETVGIPKSQWRRGYRPMGAGSPVQAPRGNTKEDLSFALKAMGLKVDARESAATLQRRLQSAMGEA